MARRNRRVNPKAPVLVDIDTSGMTPQEIADLRAELRQDAPDGAEWWRFCNTFQPEDFIVLQPQYTQNFQETSTVTDLPKKLELKHSSIFAIQQKKLKNAQHMQNPIMQLKTYIIYL